MSLRDKHFGIRGGSQLTVRERSRLGCKDIADILPDTMMDTEVVHVRAWGPWAFVLDGFDAPDWSWWQRWSLWP
jgi:hypothetical protein